MAYERPEGYKARSRADWGAKGTSAETPLTIEQIQLGAILRIADAMELMARNHDQLVRNHDFQKGRADRAHTELDRLRRSNAALRGHLARKRRDRSEGGA